MSASWAWADIYDGEGNESPAFLRALQNVEDEIDEGRRLREEVAQLRAQLADMESRQTVRAA